VNETSTTSSATDSISTAEIDVSCRAPLFTLFVSAAVWVVIASVFGLIASLKFHSPNFLSGCAWLTYGRVHPVATNALLYGFAMQAGLGVALWIIARTSQTRVVQPWLIAFGGKLWNLGLTIGLIGILAGDSTGFENLEMPRYAVVFLFLGYFVIAFFSLVTLHSRKERALGPSQWFLLAALFWFPWIYFTSNYLLLANTPVRGVTQAILAWWYSGNLNLVWFGLVGLAVIFHFTQQFMNKELHSRPLAGLTFWTIILFGSWSGIPRSAPVPA
jgi:cytochrome c oxidase cbb3-type subunit 1